jgi:aspartate kinase
VLHAAEERFLYMTASVIIRKYGGEALASPSRIRAAAEQVVARAADVPLVVVASARRGVTDHLLELVRDVGARRDSRSADRVVAAGEIVSAALLAAAIERLGRKTVALDGREAGLVAVGDWASARLRRVQPRRIRQILSAGAIPVVAGFQARRRRGLATLGRGGSDLTAVALAGALGGSCELVKDVSSLHTADPRLCPDARPLAQVSHDFLLSLARAGARVCHPRAAAVARMSKVPLRFTHFENDARGTEVNDTPTEQVAVVLRRDVALLTAEAARPIDHHGIATLCRVLRHLDAAAAVSARRNQVTVVLERDVAAAARARIHSAGFRVNGEVTNAIDAVTVVGAGEPRRHAQLGIALARTGVSPIRISSTRRRVLLIVASEQSVTLLRALHRAFVGEAGEVRCSA